MLSVRKNLTEILLEVTNEEIYAIAHDTLSKVRTKGQNKSQLISHFSHLNIYFFDFIETKSVVYMVQYIETFVDQLVSCGQSNRYDLNEKKIVSILLYSNLQMQVRFFRPKLMI